MSFSACCKKWPYQQYTILYKFSVDFNHYYIDCSRLVFNYVYCVQFQTVVDRNEYQMYLVFFSKFQIFQKSSLAKNAIMPIFFGLDRLLNIRYIQYLYSLRSTIGLQFIQMRQHISIKMLFVYFYIGTYFCKKRHCYGNATLVKRKIVKFSIIYSFTIW